MRGKPQTKGNEDDLIERRQSVREEAPENRTGIPKSEDYRVDPERSKGQKDPAANHTPPSMRQRSPGGKGEKIQKVLKRVYDGQTNASSMGAETNAGAAVTSLGSAVRDPVSWMITRTGILNSSSVVDRRAAYLAGTGRSVGRGRDLLASYQIWTNLACISHKFV